ncbi:carbohydrate binding domain-containing protein [Paenibacillus ginsengarvi]|uniref:CBM-cenC domain-containing protein n=1 Tax=Paenibacillus ginsengarvi TaxID=400777 RepID=A0A3B0C3C2_9BACL|nr:carbohydrate binding domain-containing protein [Paenibacillus ginsengarvi]RKN80523.1 hypothetical protein D7M11_20500 [Paenibacillus ginsengarvi]
MNGSGSWPPNRRWKSVKPNIAILCLLALLFQLLGITASTPPAIAQNVGDDVMQNGGFEQTAESKPLPWLAMGGWTNPEIRLLPEAARSGSAGIRIETTQSTNPWIAQDVLVEPGAVYDVSVWLKSPGVSGSVGVKFEYYKGQVRTAANRLSAYDMQKNVPAADLTGSWQNLRFEAAIPEEAGLVLVYLRMYGAGSVDWDDASFTLVKTKPLIDLTTDRIFYYADAEEGTVKAAFHSPVTPLEQLHAEARVYRDSTGVVMATYAHGSAALPMSFPFDPSLMVKDEPYRVEVRLLDSSNAVMDTVTSLVYRIDRPTMLRSDGTVLVDGEPFFPIAAYHVRLTDYPYLHEAGINTVQGIVTNSANALQSALDAAQMSGLKVMVPLYYNMKVKENAAQTALFVNRFKTHPAVLAWMIMDEPFSNGKTLQELADAYGLIRSLDKAHPTYMVEALPPYYAETAKVTDILVTDVYTIPRDPISLVGERTAMAKQAAREKPVWNVLQAMYNPPNWPVLPTIADVRNTAYQSLLNGLQGIAYYSVNENTFQLRDSELWPGLVDFREELGLFGRLVTEGSRIGQGQTEYGRWAVWEDGGVRYAAAVNTSDVNREMSISLGITGYRAELLYGDTRSVLDSQGGALTVDLGPKQSLLYRITSFESRMMDALAISAQASGLSADVQWTSGVSQLEAKLNAIRDELAGSAPDPDAAVQAAIQAFGLTALLADWANQLGSGSPKPDMLGALGGIREQLGPIAASYVQSELQVEGDLLVGQEELNELAFTMRNGAGSGLQNVQVTLKLPEAFGLEPDTRTVAQLGSGQSATETFSFRIAGPLSLSSYPLQAFVEFEYANQPGVRITTDKYLRSSYTDLLTVQTEPGVIRANKGGSYPFTLNVKNNVPRSLEVGFEQVPPVSGMTVQVPAPLLVPGNQQATVSGTVYLPQSVTDGVYTATIQVKADGKLVRSIPVQASVDKNRLINPGFEQANVSGTGPAGWLMRKGNWVQDAVYGGQYAVSLQPDAANAWNVINSDLIAAEPGVNYVLRGWVKNSAAAGTVSIGLRQVKQDGVSTIGYTWKEIPHNSGWTLYKLEVTAASTTGYVQVYLLSDTAANGEAWFDELYVGERG